MRLALALGALLLAGPTTGVPADPPQAYLVQADEGAADQVVDTLAELGAAPRAAHALVDGFTVELTDAQAAALAHDPDVRRVVPEVPITISDTVDTPGSWGQDRIDQAALPLDGSFSYDRSAGTLVRVYVVDTGVAPDPTFEERLLPGFTAIADGRGTTDCHGHGTHVAGTVASAVFGVAKAAWVVPVRVLDCTGQGTSTTLLAGLDWIAAHHPAGTPGVVNLSLGGDAYAALDDAVQALVALGLTVAVAAGNENVDACERSPAAAPDALTVGATTSTDARAEYSNWGGCLDLFAPGSSILSLSTTPGVAQYRSGTSMATPHVAGVAALYLADHPDATPAQVRSALLYVAAPVVTATAGSTDLLLQLPAGVNEPLPGPVRWLVATAGRSAGYATWVPPSTLSREITGYRVQVRTDGGAWQTVAVAEGSRTSWTPTAADDVRVQTMVGGLATATSSVVALNGVIAVAPAEAPATTDQPGIDEPDPGTGDVDLTPSGVGPAGVVVGISDLDEEPLTESPADLALPAPTPVLGPRPASATGALMGARAAPSRR